jgi:hypothetical protein
LAESYVTGDSSISAGDVVKIATDMSVQTATGGAVINKGVLMKADYPYDNHILGIISTDPALTLGSKDEGTNQSDQRIVALSGRVPVKIDPASPPITVGDFLTASTKPGYAIKATKAGYTVAKALESWSPDRTGTIMAFVNLGYYDPDVNGNISQYSLLSSIASDSGTLVFQIQNGFGEAITRAMALSQAMIANLSAGAIQAQTIATNQLSVGGVAIQDFIDQRILALSSQGLITPIASSSGITRTIGSDGSENLMIKLGNSNATGSAVAQLYITDRNAKTVASFDELGNATLAGTLTANNAILGSEATPGALLVNGDATISGTLYANNLSGLEERIRAVLSASDSGFIAPTATPSGDLLASLTASDSALLEKIAELSTGYVASNSAMKDTTLVADDLVSKLQINVGNPSNGSGMVLDHNSISTTDTTLYFQPAGNAALAFLGDAMTLTTAGGLTVNTNAIFNQNVTIAENLMVRSVYTGEGDFQLHLNATASSTLAKFAILDSTNTEVASIDASGAGSFKRLIIASDNIAPDSSSSVSGTVSTNASTGQASLAAGQTSLTISAPHISGTSLIYVTPTSSTSNEVLYVKSKQSEDATHPIGSFTISLDQALPIPVSFNWWIIN